MIREKRTEANYVLIKILRIMKRLFLTVMAVLSMTMTFAENEELNTVSNANAYKMSVNYSKLADALGLSLDQQEAVQDIHSEFCADMLNAGNANDDERKDMVEKALTKDLKHMRSVLSDNQYRTYLMLLNTTIVNRGLNK